MIATDFIEAVLYTAEEIGGIGGLCEIGDCELIAWGLSVRNRVEIALKSCSRSSFYAELIVAPNLLKKLTNKQLFGCFFSFFGLRKENKENNNEFLSK